MIESLVGNGPQPKFSPAAHRIKVSYQPRIIPHRKRLCLPPRRAKTREGAAFRALPN
jgi:hypothetical protein